MVFYPSLSLNLYDYVRRSGEDRDKDLGNFFVRIERVAREKRGALKKKLEGRERKRRRNRA